jgi:nucleoside-diphosphate-sugar epimerase
MNNLIIGDTSQLSFYFPKNYHKISSRNIDLESIKKNNYDSIFILFAEQRTFLNETEYFFTKINVDYTLKVIDNLKDYCNRIIIYSTSELWNNCESSVSVDDKFDYNYTPYIKSKEILSNTILERKSKYSNVHIIYPFNFNSPYRKPNFLFSKIFDSIINNKVNTVGDLNFKRDIVHPSIIVKESINATKDLLIGSGELIDVESFIIELFTLFNMNFYDYILFEKSNNLSTIRKNFFSEIKYSNYKELLNLTLNDIRKNKFSQRHY